MASSPAPTTPDNLPRRSSLNRSVTAPIRSSPATAKPPPEIGATEGVETLFTHPNANVIKFTTTASRPSSSSPSRQQTGGTALLPWTSTTERTVAVGQLSVYRVPGSVSFLNSGNLLHAFLPRSQCWCVDGISKFALRVLPDTYYRIELPGETEEDKEEVERFKTTLQKVCFYERTPCPFDRGFDVEIENEVDLNLKKNRRKSQGPAKKWKLDRAHSWKPEGWQPPERTGSGDETTGMGSSTGSEEDESEGISGKDDSGADEKGREVGEGRVNAPITPSRVRAARKLLEQRSVTAPAAQLTLQSPSPSRLRTRVDVDGTVEVAEPAVVEGASEPQTERLRTFQAIPTNMPPSPPDSSAGVDHTELQRESSSEHLSEPDTEAAEPDYTEPDGRHEELVEGSEGHESAFTIHEEESDDREPAREDGGYSEEDALDTPPTTQLVDQEIESFHSNPPQAAEQRPSTPPNRDSDLERRQNDLITTEPAAEKTESPRYPSSSPRRSSKADNPPTAEDAIVSRTPSPSPTKAQRDANDPFAAIQARILARRSIGGTTSFPSSQSPPARQSPSSSSSNSTLSRHSASSSSRQQQAFATAMVKKACSVFLGPPAHLVAIMLRIAARFARGAFGVESAFYVESPAGAKGRVPGSYQVFANGEVEGEDMEEEEEEWEEDDFGVPLRGPVRLASLSSLRSSTTRAEGMRERGGRGWDAD